jgi:hypothetical protein
MFKAFVLFSTLGFAAATTATNASAETVFVREAEGNLSKEELQTVRELVKIGVSKNGHTNADEGKASTKLQPSALKLGNSIVLSIKKQQSGKADFVTGMKAKNLDELDTVSSRVVRSVMNEQTTEESATVQDVSQEEEFANTRRFQATRHWQFGFGPAWGHNLRATSGGTNWSLGFTWGIDPRFDLSIVWDFFFGRNSNAYANNFALGGTYLFSLGKHTPFVGADVGYMRASADKCTTTNCDNSAASGWSTGITAGYRFFRTSNVNFAVAGRYAHLFDEVSNLGQPGIFSLRVIVYY